MQLSAAAVCTITTAQSLDYAAQWLTEWYAYNDHLLKKLAEIVKIK